ncbi:hypothetical protein ISS07_06950 [Candidatus Woesearchaeota archaeon]|nr:hypothetical protein [Candidatus Woesearchaeota archaeon]
MSAEKEIVNFWLNRKGYFTINNIKTGNKDAGIIALKFSESKVVKIVHVEVHCSLTGSEFSIEKEVKESFDDNSIRKAIDEHTKSISTGIKVEKVLVTNNISASKKEFYVNLYNSNINMFEFEDIFSDVMKDMKTSYFRNDVIRTVQLMKSILANNPKKFVNILCDVMPAHKRKEFIAELLDKEDIIKEFKKTKEERLAEILKYSMIKPEKLAAMLEKEVLTSKTRKRFVDSFTIKEETRVKENPRKEELLDKFFE